MEDPAPGAGARGGVLGARAGAGGEGAEGGTKWGLAPRQVRSGGSGRGPGAQAAPAWLHRDAGAAKPPRPAGPGTRSWTSGPTQFRRFGRGLDGPSGSSADAGGGGSGARRGARVAPRSHRRSPAGRGPGNVASPPPGGRERSPAGRRRGAPRGPGRGGGAGCQTGRRGPAFLLEAPCAAPRSSDTSSPVCLSVSKVSFE